MIRRRGLTLLEVIIAISLMVLLIASMFAFYNISLSNSEAGRRKLDQGELAWLTLLRIAEEVRAANGFVPSLGPGIRGLRQEITLQTVTLPDRKLFIPRAVEERPLPAECDVREVRYYLGIDPEETEDYIDPTDPAGVVNAPRTFGIVRREVKTFRQVALQTGQREEYDVELLSSQLRYLRFRYFDGVDWVDVWQPPGGGMGNSLPQAVEITVGYDAEPPQDPNELDFDQADLQPSLPEPYHPQRYSLVVRLNQADTFFGSRILRAGRRAASGASGGGSAGGGLGS